ncbi:hypothetical protein D3C75_1113630 [compost metagenome]
MWFFKEVVIIVPITATPMVPPMFRNSCDEAVATPSSVGLTAFCTVRENTGMPRPKPAPNTIMAITAIHTESMYAIISMPATMMGKPNKANFLYLPVLVIIRPVMALTNTIARDMGMVTYPE